MARIHERCHLGAQLRDLLRVEIDATGASENSRTEFEHDALVLGVESWPRGHRRGNQLWISITTKAARSATLSRNTGFPCREKADCRSCRGRGLERGDEPAA